MAEFERPEQKKITSPLRFEYNPDTEENIIRRAKKLREQIAQDIILARKPTQEELSKIVFEPFDKSGLHIDFEGYFEDY